MDASIGDAVHPARNSWAAWRSIAARTWKEASDDNIGLIAAGVAFYGFLALVPLLTAIVLTYGIFADPPTVVRHMHAMTAIMPTDVASAIGDQLMTVVKGSDGPKGLGVLLAIAIALFGARNGAGALVSALNVAYDEAETRGFLRLNLIALAITAAAALVAVLAALSVAALAALAHLLPYINDLLVIAGTILSYALLTLAGAGGAAALYRFAPCRSDARWIWISPGSLLTGLLWLGLTLGFGAYVGSIGHYDATYGSLGTVIALLTWMYLSCYLLLFGAELNSELDHRNAAERPGAAVPALSAEPVTDDRPALSQAISGPPAPAAITAAKEHEFLTSRVSGRVARLGGLPQIGWLTSAMASVGLAMLRRRGRAGAGLALVAGAVGISWLRPRR